MKKLLIIPDRCNGCRECELACAAKQRGTLKLLKRRGPDGKLSHPRIKLTKKHVQDSLISIIPIKKFTAQCLLPGTNTMNAGSYFPLLCLHCDDAPCIDACISGAMKRDRKTGLVNVDREQCVGCWSCVMACPFGAVSRGRNNDKPALKCDGCLDLGEPACVKFCKAKALVFVPIREFVKTLRRLRITRFQD